MTLEELEAIFHSDEDDDEFLKFDRIPQERRLSNRPDLHAFLVLDRMIPDTRDMICAAEHDEVFLRVTPKELAEKATREDVIDLIRCGVRHDSSNDCLAMFA